MGGSVAVAVGVSDRFCPFLSVLVLVLISAHIERFNVFRMQNFSFHCQYKLSNIYISIFGTSGI